MKPPTLPPADPAFELAIREYQSIDALLDRCEMALDATRQVLKALQTSLKESHYVS